MMATVPRVNSGLGLRKFHADGFLLTRVYVIPLIDCQRITSNDFAIYVVRTSLLPVLVTAKYNFGVKG